MKKITLFTFALLSLIAFTGSAQNAIDVRGFVSPTSGFNYDSSATEDIEIRFRNDGPQTLFAQDSIFFNLTIGAGDSTEFYQIKKRVDFTLNPGDNQTYVLLSGYNFKWENDYTVCATALGTNDYPNNTNKNSRACVSFIVGIEDIQLELNQVYFADNQINFNLNENEAITAFVYDITGKILLEKRLSNGKNQSLDFSSPANGFYFLKVLNSKGQSDIAKFVTN